MTSFWKIRPASSSNKECAIILVARNKPECSHYKAGNFNSFLYNHLPHEHKINVATPPLQLLTACMLDHGMLPAPIELKRSLASFEDPQTGFIQYPQRLYDIQGRDLSYAGDFFVVDGVQINRGAAGLAAFAGTNAI
jgi:hypothetical protein